MADYEELIGAKFSFGNSLDQALAQYDQFIKTLNDKGSQVKLGVGSGGALDGVVKQLQDVKAQLGGLASQWKEVFGTGADAAEDSTKSIKQSVADAESAFISAQTKQTESAQAQSAKRIEIAQSEANAIRRTQEELKAKSQITPEVSRYGSQFFQQELQRIKDTEQARLKAKDQFGGAQQYGSGVVEKEISRLETAQQKFAVARQSALKGAASGAEFEGSGAIGSSVVEKEISRLEKLNAARQAALKGAPSRGEFEGANAYGSPVVEKELGRLKAEQQAQLKAPTRDSLQGAQSYGSQFVANELKKLEDSKANSGIGGFFSGIKTGLAPRGDSSAASIGEFVGQATRFVAAYAAIRAAAEAAGAAIKAPFEIIKDGIEYLTQFQERASEIKATLLDHGFFSKDPAENLQLAGQAADDLAKKVENLADKLNVKPETIQAAFNTFSDYGGNGLTGSPSDSVQLAGLATAALQSQNPRIQQRTVATQLQKLTSGDLKDTDKLPAALGISADKLNEMVQHARTAHDLLQQIQDNAPGLADRLGTANDRLAPLEDTLERVKQRLEGILSQNAVQVLTDSAKDLVGWLDKNKETLDAIATTLGSIAGTSLSVLIDSFKQLLPIIGPLAKILATSAAKTAAGVGGLAALTGSESNAISPIDVALGNNTVGEWWKNRKQNAFGFKQAQDYSDQQTANIDKLGNALDGHPNGPDDVLGGSIPAALRAPGVPDVAYTNTTPTPKPKPKNVNTSSDQIAAIRNSYSEQIAEVKKQSAAIRSAIEEDAKNFRISLIDAADLKEAAYQEETEKVTAAGEKAKTALAKVVAGKDPARTQNAKNSVLKSINENNLGVGLDSDKSKTAGQDAIDKQSDAVDATNRAADQERATALLNADYAYKQQLQKQGVISDGQALDNEQSYWDKLYKIRLDGIQKSVDAEKKDSLGDPAKLAALNKQREAALTDQSIQNQKIQRQRQSLPYDDAARQYGSDVGNAQLEVTTASARTDIDRHAGLTDTARRDNATLAGTQTNLLRSQLDQATNDFERTRQQFLQANPNATPQDLASNSALSTANAKVQTINAELIKAESLEANLGNQGKSLEEATDALLGAGNNLTGQHFKGSQAGVFGDIGQTASSIGNIAKTVSGGVGAVESGYQQGGAGGAVGAGLSQIGALIPGIGGQIVSGIGSVISTVSALFTQAAQEIGKQVGLAVDKAMEKYSSGQTTLSQTLTTVQQQYASLVAKETGRKGGQQVLDTEGLQLQQQIDQLKQQQQQTVNNFADQTIVSGGTNSVAQQWLQTWISVNKQVQQYENAVGNSAATQLANQYLNEQLDQERKSLQDQYIQGQASAVNDALQLNQLLQQRNNYEDQYRQQVFSLQSQDSLARRGNPAEETARQITLAKSQYNQQTQQLNFEINTYQQKVAYEQQIFGLATTTAALQQQALTDQGYQLNEQIQQYQTIVALLASITGVTAVNGQIPGLSQLGITLPTNYGVNDGSLNPIPGYGAPGTTDNSSTQIVINIPAGALPTSGSPQDYATAIGNELAYRVRTGSASAL